jgi:acylphosphatase
LEETFKCVRLVIAGRVQGVWFRGWTVEEAGLRGLSGWVRNRRDGTVEAVFAGSPTAVDAMIEACWRGPPAASVHHVEQFAQDTPVAPGFHSRPTV